MSSKAAPAGKDKLIDEDEEVLQAVILADSFNKRFRPLTTRKPRVRTIVHLMSLC
jgi:translation initiation factor eIF-2B subunit epsilon